MMRRHANCLLTGRAPSDRKQRISPRILALAGAAGKDGNRSKSAKMQDCAAGVAGRLTDD